MTFSEFAKMMHGFIFTEDNNPDFLIKMIGKIMDDPDSEETDKEDKDDKYNPMCGYQPNTLTKIYNGQTEISKKKVNKILTHSNEDKFNCFIVNSIGELAINNLKEALEKKDIKVDSKYETGEICASLLISILKNISAKSGTEKSRNNSSNYRKSVMAQNDSNIQQSEVHGTIIHSPQIAGINEIAIPPECQICFCCEYWCGNRPSFFNSRFESIKIEGKCIHNYESEVKEYTYKDGCDKFYPETRSVSQYELVLRHPSLKKSH